ncbi:SCO2400 family protein, partial [Actinacidiphila rubida]
MDYCYSCRRTLNGALVCPGCGAYAPDIAPPASAYMGNTAAAPAAWDAFGAAPSGHPGASAGPLPTMQNMQVPGYAAPGEHAYAAPYAEPGLPGGAHPAAGHGYAGRDAVRIEPARPRPATPRRLPAELTEEDGDLPGGELPGGDVPSVLGPPSLGQFRGQPARSRRPRAGGFDPHGVPARVTVAGGGVCPAGKAGLRIGGGVGVFAGGGVAGHLHVL